MTNDDLIAAVQPDAYLLTKAVERVLDGDMTLAKDTTPAERRLICQGWAKRGRSLRQLEKHTGWKPERYYETQAAA